VPPAGILHCDTTSSVADVSSEHNSCCFRRSNLNPLRSFRKVGNTIIRCNISEEWDPRTLRCENLRNGNSYSDLAGCDAVHTGPEDECSVVPKFSYQNTRLHGAINTNTTVSVFTSLKISNYRHIYIYIYIYIYTGRLYTRNVIKNILFLKVYDYRTACYT